MKSYNCYLRETITYTHCIKVMADTEDGAVVIMWRLYNKGTFGATLENRTQHDVEIRAYLETPRIIAEEDET